jgi:alkyl sulfatase BDS1-like metallo-beta-lactamase superfamily hydrolase
MGGADAVVAKAASSFEAGDYRWAAEVLNHVVFAEPSHAAAKELLADTYEQLGYGAENGTWRNFFLSGAYELRQGPFGTPAATASPDMLAQLTPAQFFDALAVRVDGPSCWDETITLDVTVTDLDQSHRLTLRNGVLTHTTARQPAAADVALRLPKAALAGLVAGATDPQRLADSGVAVEGDVAALQRLIAVLDPPDPDFAIVTP